MLVVDFIGSLTLSTWPGAGNGLDPLVLGDNPVRTSLSLKGDIAGEWYRQVVLLFERTYEGHCCNGTVVVKG